MEEMSKYQDTIENMMLKDKAENSELMSEMEQRIATNDDRAFSSIQQTEKDLKQEMKKLHTQIKSIFSDAAIVENKVKKLIEKKPEKAGLSGAEVEEIVNAAQVNLFDTMLELKEKIEGNQEKFEKLEEMIMERPIAAPQL